MHKNSLSKQANEEASSKEPLSCPKNTPTSDEAWRDYRDTYAWVLETCKAWLQLDEYLETHWDAIDDYPSATLVGFQNDLMLQLQKDVDRMVEANKLWAKLDAEENQ